MCGKIATFFYIYSEHLGNGPLYVTEAEAEEELNQMLEEDPGEDIRICMTEMLAENYTKLPEFEGY